MRVTIKTRREGAMSFWMNDRGDGRARYVFLESAGREGTTGSQICEGGGFRGSTLTATPDTLASVVRRWIRQRRAAERRACA